MTPELRFALGDVLEAAGYRRDQWQDTAEFGASLPDEFSEASDREARGIAERLTRSISIVQEYLEKGATRDARHDC